MSGVLYSLRQEIADRLSADSYFADVSVFTERKGDLENEIARALGVLTEAGGKIGVCAIVIVAAGGVKKPNLPGPYLDPVDVVVHVEENVLINSSTDGTLKPATDVAERVARVLHHWTPDGRSQALVPASNCIAAVSPAIGDVAYAVRFTTAIGLDALALTQLATPTASPDGGAAPATVTLACATAGAAVYYTADGSLPSPRNGTLYTVPFAVAAAATVKARAWLAGYLASEIKTAVFT